MVILPGLISSDYKSEVLKLLPAFYFRLGESYKKEVLKDKPILYYRLGESSGTSAVDSSTGGNNGTYTTSYTQGQAGALSGDSDTAVTLGSTGYIAPTAFYNGATFSIEAWIKFSSNPGSQATIASKCNGYGTGTTDYQLALHPSGFVNWYLYPAGTIDSSVLSTGVWHHVVATADGTSQSIYIDGVLNVTASLGSGYTGYTAPNLWVGTQSSGIAAFTGSLDEVAFYPVALSATRIAAHYNVAIGKAYDETSKTHSGVYTATGVTNSQSPLIKNDLDNAVLFNGTSGRMHGPSALNNYLNGKSSFSLTLWLSYTTTISSAIAAIAGWWWDQSNLFQISTSNRLNFQALFSGGGFQLFHSSALNDGLPHMVAFTAGSGTATLYVDGISVNSTTYTGTCVSTNSGFGLAAYCDSNFAAAGNFFPGYIDEVAGFNTTLTAAQVRILYNKGKGK